MENQNIDQFEKYLKGNMQEEERRNFLQSLKENERLQKQFSAYVMAHEAIEEEVRRDLKSRMNAWNTPKEPSNGGWGVISLILVILMGIAIASIIWICPQEEEVVWDQYAAVNVEALQRSVGPSEEIRQLNQFYITGNYAKAQQMIDQMNPGIRDQADVQFIQALLDYQNEDFQTALSIFSLLKINEDLHFSIREQAAYYYLLTLVRMDKCTGECIQDLKDIAADNNHLRQNEAKKLLNEISL